MLIKQNWIIQLENRFANKMLITGKISIITWKYQKVIYNIKNVRERTHCADLSLLRETINHFALPLHYYS